MCCLAFECNHYRSERAEMPRMNSFVETPEGTGKVTKLNILAHMVEVTIPESTAPFWVHVDTLLGRRMAEKVCGGINGDPCCATRGSEVDKSLIPEDEAVKLADDESAPLKKRSRRRRKKRLTEANAAPQETTPPVTSSSPDADAPTPEKRRTRKRKPRKKTEAAAVATAANADSVAVAMDATPAPAKVPSGRYRPRRRHSPPPGGSVPQP